MRPRTRVVVLIVGILVSAAASLVVAPPLAGPVTASAAPVFELPVIFVEDRGHAAESVAYEASLPGSSFRLAASGIAMTLTPATAEGGSDDVAPTSLQLRFVDANPDVRLQPAQTSTGSVNLIRGNDPDNWQLNVPAHTSIGYWDLWDGINLRVRSQAGALKYEFVVSPGADPALVRLIYEGAAALRIEDRRLAIDTHGGVLSDAAPTAFQVIEGETVAVDVDYKLDGATGYGFEIGTYDVSRDLVIDPSIDYSTFIGGSLDERANDIAVDSTGSAYITGNVQSTTGFPTVNAVSNNHNGGTFDTFVAKFNPDGGGLVYATYLGGSPTALGGTGATDDLERASAIEVDSAGNAYVVGVTSALDFPTTPGAFQPANAAPPLNERRSSKDGFVTKLTPAGALAYSTYIGGSADDQAFGIDVDANGTAYVVGITGSSNFPITAGAFQPTLAGGSTSNYDGFFVTFDPSGSSLGYATYLGGTDNDNPGAVVAASPNSVYIAGETRSIDFPTTAGAFQPAHSSPTPGGPFDPAFEIFATKLDPSAAGLEYSTFIGTPGTDLLQGLVVDDLGRAHLTGNAGSTTFPTTSGAYDTTSGGGFYARLSPTAADLEYSTFLGGAFASDLERDLAGDVWIAGTSSVGPTTPDAIQIVNAGSTDMWLGQLDAQTGQLNYGTFLGGTEIDNATGLAIGDTGHLYLSGVTTSANFPTTPGAFDRTFDGNPQAFWGDAVVVKIDPADGTPPPPPPPVEFETVSFSNEIRRDSSLTHTIPVGAAGNVDIDLNWDDDRADVDVTVLDPSGAVIFSDTGTARPKVGTFPAASVGDHEIQLRNTTDRDTDYTLTVTYPVSGGTTPPPPSNPVLTGASIEPSAVLPGAGATGHLTLSAMAPTGGTIVNLVSSSTLVQVPPTVTVQAGQSVANYPVTTSQTTNTVSATVTATLDGTSLTATIEIRPAPLPDLNGVSFDPQSVLGGETSTGTVQLAGPAPAEGLQVDLSSDSVSASVPASLTVAPGATSATFTVSTTTVATTQNARITARRVGGFPSVSSNLIEIREGGTPPPPGPTIETVFAPASLVGGESGTGAVQLVGPAPTGGVDVTLSSSHPAVAVPSTLTIPQGNSAASYAVTTSTVTSEVTATITATLGSSTGSATVTVTPAEPPPPPPPPPPPSDNETVSFSGKIRRNVTLTHSIDVGAAGDVGFNLDWDEDRADVDVTVLDPSGAVIFNDSGSAHPKVATFQVSSVGEYRIQLRNTTRRNADYTLSVTYPFAGGT